MTIFEAGVFSIVIALATGCASEANDRAETFTTAEEATTTTIAITTTISTLPPTTTVPAGPPTLAMGETLSLTITEFNDETYVEITVANPATFTESPIQYGGEPQNGLYLVVDVTVAVAANSAGTYSASPNGFKFVAADGTAANAGFAIGFDPQLPYINLSAGQQASGKVVFDINPAHQPGGRVQIDDVGANYGEPFAYWGPL